MIRSVLHRYVRHFEQQWHYDAQYMHDIVDASPAAALKFSALQPMTQHRDGVGKDAWHAAHLAGALCEDCGPCVQISVDMATNDGVAPEKLAALIRGDVDEAGPDAALGFRYGVAVATNSDATMDLIEQARARFGERGLVSLAFSVTTARMYPTLKRGLGHGAVCARVTVSNETIAVKQAA